MATFTSYPVPASPITSGGNQTLFSGALTASTSTAALVVGYRTIIGISVVTASAGTPTDVASTAGVHIRFGNPTVNAGSMPAATSSDFFIPPASIVWFDTGEEFDRIKLLTTAATNTVFYTVYAFTRT